MVYICRNGRRRDRPIHELTQELAVFVTDEYYADRTDDCLMNALIEIVLLLDEHEAFLERERKEE